MIPNVNKKVILTKSRKGGTLDGGGRYIPACSRSVWQGNLPDARAEVSEFHACFMVHAARRELG